MPWFKRLIIIVLLAALVLGLLSFQRLPQNLFPQTNYPSVSVLLVWPGAAGEDVQGRMTRYVDAELASLGQSRKVRGVSRDEVAA